MEEVVASHPSESRGRAVVDDVSNPGSSGHYGLRSIVVCLDRSSLSEQCLPYALSLASVFGSVVTLLLVLEPSHQRGAPRATDALEWEISRQEASGYLTTLARQTRQATGLQVETRVEQGSAAERIATVTREVNADLTVLGDHGEGGVSAWRLGSTVAQVLAASRGSILLGRAALPSTGAKQRPTLLVPLDGSARTESVLPTVVRLARARGAEVLLTHAVTEPQRTFVLSSEEDLALARELAAHLESGAKRYLEQLRERLARDVEVRTMVVRTGDPRASLLDLVGQEGVELIVVSAHGSTCNQSRSFGDVSSYLLTHATVPVLMLQDMSTGDSGRPPEGNEDRMSPAPRVSVAPGNS